MKYIFVVALALVAPIANAAEKNDYKFCTAAGYWLGANDPFMGQLAAHIVSKRGLMSDPVCMSAWKAASEVGRRVTQHGFTNEDMPVVKQANEISNKVYDFIEVNAGL